MRYFLFRAWSAVEGVVRPAVVAGVFGSRAYWAPVVAPFERVSCRSRKPWIREVDRHYNRTQGLGQLDRPMTATLDIRLEQWQTRF